MTVKQTQVGGLQSYHLFSCSFRRLRRLHPFFRGPSCSISLFLLPLLIQEPATQTKPLAKSQFRFAIRPFTFSPSSGWPLRSMACFIPLATSRVNPKCSSAKRNRSALPSSHAAQPVVPNDLCFGGFRWSASRKKVKQHLVLPSCRLAVLPSGLCAFASSQPEWSWPDNRDRLCPGDWAPGLPSWQQIESTIWTEDCALSC